MRSIVAVGLVVILAGCVQAQPSVGAWQVPAEGPPLNAGVVMQLAGKTCWGFFDKGINSETARGAVFIRFSPSSQSADFGVTTRFVQNRTLSGSGHERSRNIA
jgi:hypothetical protein